MKMKSIDNLQIDVRSMTTTTLSEGESEFSLGDLLLHLNRPVDAEPHLTAAISKSPTLSSTQTTLALSRVRQKKYDEAVTLLKKAAESHSKKPRIKYYSAYGP